MSDIQVNTTTSGNQTAPEVAMDGDGDYVVVWQSAGQDGNNTGVFMASTSSLTCFLRGTLIATDRGEWRWRTWPRATWSPPASAACAR